MGWVVNATTRPLYPQERPGTHCIGGWVGRRAGLDGCGKSCPHRDSIPRPSIPSRVAITTELSRPTTRSKHDFILQIKPATCFGGFMLLITEIYTGFVELRCWLHILKTRLQLNFISYTIMGHCFHLPPRGQCVVTGVLVKYTNCGNMALTYGASVMG